MTKVYRWQDQVHGVGLVLAVSGRVAVLTKLAGYPSGVVISRNNAARLLRNVKGFVLRLL